MLALQNCCFVARRSRTTDANLRLGSTRASVRTDLKYRITLDKLAVFVAVAEREHVSRGADDLNLTQSTVSAAIACLERALCSKLFHRVGRNVALTESGRFFLTEARAILARAEAATHAMREMADLKHGHVTIKASQCIVSHFLPQRLVAFNQAYPGIVVEVSIGNAVQITAAVIEGAVELGLIAAPVDSVRDSRLVTELISEDRMVAVVAADHPLAGCREFTAAELASLSWAVREDGSGSRVMFHERLTKLGVPIADQRISIELPSNEAVLTAVIQGVGPALLPERVCADSIAAQRLMVLPITPEALPCHSVQHGDYYRSRAVSALLEMLKAPD